MLLAIDIGNTNINNGVFQGRTLKKRFRVPTYSKDLEKQYRPYAGKVDVAVIVSVVPKVLQRLDRALKKISVGKILVVVGRDIDSGVKNLYKNPGQVGQDRLVNARAAYELYGGAAIVVDFGTAITIDVVNRKKEYLGGVIAPGVEISLNALSEQAYLLPKVRLRKAKSILGKETSESMISGAIYGFSGLCDGLVEKLKKKYCRNARVIATGGMSTLIGTYCKGVDRIDPDLTLKGLRLIGDENV